MVELLDRCRKEFDGRDLARGIHYYGRGAASILAGGRDWLGAAVRGSASKPYRVLVDWSEARQKTLLVDCSCPRFADVGRCKHLVAVLLAADIAQLNRKVPGTGPLLVDLLDADRRRYLIARPEPGGRFDGDELSGDEPLAAAADDDAPDDHALDDDDADELGGARWPAARAARVDCAVGRGEALRAARSKRSGSRASVKRGSNWQLRLDTLAALNRRADHQRRAPAARQIWYLLDLRRTSARGRPCVLLYQQSLRSGGRPAMLKPARLMRDDVAALPSAEDRLLVELLAGNEPATNDGYGGAWRGLSRIDEVAVAPALYELVLPRLCGSGRFGWLADNPPHNPPQPQCLAWDDGPAWQLTLDVSKPARSRDWRIGGRLTRGDEVEQLSRPLLVLESGLVVFPDRIARLEAGDRFAWLEMLRLGGELSVPSGEAEQLVARLALLRGIRPDELPVPLRWSERRPAPVPELKIKPDDSCGPADLECRLSFDYEGRSVAFDDEPAVWYDAETRSTVFRDLAAEAAHRDALLAAGARAESWSRSGRRFGVSRQRFAELVRELTARGWKVEGEQGLIRRPGSFTFCVTSGVDWFDLEGVCDFGGATAALPAILKALENGERFVRLDDGSQGILPEDWLTRYAPLASLAETRGRRLRFVPSQAALLDTLLAAQDAPRVRVDRAFAAVRKRLAALNGIRPRHEPASFAGRLRDYQREGLGWLAFLAEFGFGGCLADDMGLGKTVQVLALLDGRCRPRGQRGGPHHPAARGTRAARRPGRAARGPSLVVVPRSLVFNWIEEARRFAPRLRVLDYTGVDRGEAAKKLGEADLVVTTYGTVRRDIQQLRKLTFDYAILDEAQAIKNASSQAAKACRLLSARRRLAMTGTPVENHLGELWSLFEFLNPGLLGRSPQLCRLLSPRRRGDNGRGPQNDRAAMDLLARALRPFLLRRTKDQVLRELPAKTEQTLWCELEGAQRKLYDELRAHYRRQLMARIDRDGVAKSKIHVLEALLRLRQAACHPGLIDKAQAEGQSAKLTTLLAQLAEVLDEGHKALVFSQFTSLLAIVRAALDRRKLVYEYLDGQTRKRQQRVERFQSDPACRLFLISLKAGGQGLNLAAADYVFILDPWWNPAVEAQAVDRAHRLGQTRNVFAYRLIARDTVEEKILELQQEKRELANAIVAADNSLLRNLTADDLQLLLS